MLLRPRHFKAIELLALTDMSKAQIACELDVSERALRKWMDDPDFSRELNRWQKGDRESLRLIGLHAVRTCASIMLRSVHSRIEDPPPGAVLSLLGRLLRETPDAPIAGPEPELTGTKPEQSGTKPELSGTPSELPGTPATPETAPIAQ